ncbi:MAG TPA: hypothetical protein VMG63_14980 [Terriglobia bacterium]|nr:hypothetical protein [Terriglobia bacterium]
MKFAKRVFLVAGVYGVIVIVPMYFAEGRIGRDHPPAITHPEFYYGFLGVALAWQVVFLVLAQDPSRYRPMVIPSVLEKVSYGIAPAVLLLEHRIPLVVFGLDSVDWIFAVLFVAAYLATPAGAA